MKLKGIFSTVLALGALHGLPALADTSYPGSLCHPDNPADPPYTVREDRGIFNRGNNLVLISCPIVRDITGDEDGPRQVQVYVNGTVECVLNARDLEGDLGNSDQYRDRAEHQGTGDGTLYLSTNLGFNGGPYEFQCFLDNGAGVTGYYVDE